MSPSAESARLTPNLPSPTSPPPVSFGPCWLHAPAERVKTQAAPLLMSSFQAPISAVLPSAESETIVPNLPFPASSEGVNFGPCWLQVVPERVKTQAAPLPL